MSSKNKKKLKMERLSPIPATDLSHLVSDSLHTPVRPAVPPSRQRQKDAYAIEITSSPEFNQPSVAAGVSSLQKQRRIRNIARSKVPKKTNSTPLSGLICRKPVDVAPKETPQSGPFSSPTLADPTDCSQREGLLLSIPEELPQIDDFSTQKPAHSPRHLEMISASAVFPQKPQTFSSSTTPLAGMVNKKSTNSNHSLNDSILVLREAEDSSDDDEIASNTSWSNLPKSDAENVSIESFESPQKPRYVLPKEHTTSASMFKTILSHSSKNLMRENLDNVSPITEKSISNIVEMCGNERKNRKRALDFNSTKFTFPTKSEDCEGGRQYPALIITSLSESGMLNAKPPNHERVLDCQLPSPDRLLSLDRENECQSTNAYLVSPNRDGERICQSPILDLMSPSCDTENDSRSPVLKLISPCRDSDSKSPILIVEPTNFHRLNLMPPRHDRANQQSPVLDFTPLDHKPEADRQSPDLHRMLQSGDPDCQSPILSLDPPKADNTNPKSPVLDLMALDHELQADHLPPILIPSSLQREPKACRQSPILNLKPTKPANLDTMSPSFCSSQLHFKPVKSTKCHETEPHVETQNEECLSDTDSIIESTPRPSENKIPDSGGFTASSCLLIENFSPLSTSKDGCRAHKIEIPKIEEVLEETTATKCNEQCDLKLIVVSHDTSSDESANDPDLERVTGNSDDVIFPPIDGRHSPLELNYTKRPIQSFESPSKASKPFSEAVNIGAFGSPDSNASHEDQHDEEEDGTDDVIEPSTTQEYVEESEQVRPAKRRKKGSLLERVKGVIAKVDASNALFDYEIKCGLRPSKGKFVSAPLVVLKKFGESASIFLVCKPLKYCGNSSHVEDLSSFVLVHVNKLPSGASDGSVVLLHFPVNVMYLSTLHIPCVLAGHRIVLHPAEHKIDIQTIDVSALDSINPFSSAYARPMTSFRTFSSAGLRTLNDSFLCQNLTEGSNLYLTVLHVTKLYVEAGLKKISVLCSDVETQFGWLEFTSERDVRRATALEALHILSDGSQVQTKGFSVTARVRLDRKSKHLISYCSNNPVNNEMIVFSVHPKQPNWVISSTDGLSGVKKVRSSVEDILSKKTPGCRYLLEVHGIEKGSSIKLIDPQGQSIHFVVGENSYLNLDQPAPFLLDGLYFFDNKVFSDEHTRVVPIT